MSVPWEILHGDIHDPRPHHQGVDISVSPVPRETLGCDAQCGVNLDFLGYSDLVS